ncbi:hypothetical protein A3743_03240 [Oleiphilus sp. HI0072]|uniref:UDP-N-acetylmuramate dehydrogenase n=1 Tax=unclassified Oleiphilus TaxID=2631174 RepID=UPI0007C3924C|nr:MULTISPECIES: UDP-N-acetylmuramate dehydrogenase [unclassified Oleiphilus]KZY39874.1 hypothetical protein A3729_02025 [Oleiphilus sp. HI0043]KZY85543.1 hypothetical protein A3743_03240 [Oleiphilus sp. HI0072]KZZ70405.1 hypothetical protein A3763_01385 [Oleiphilus sp. HI0128]
MNKRLGADLKSLNTLALPCVAREELCFDNAQELVLFLQGGSYELSELLILGGGSNLVLPERLDKLVIRLLFDAIHYHDDDTDHVIVVVEAGRIWDDLVADTVNQGLVGLENLSYIPGTVGAAPVQNIGAYGVELSDSLVSVKAFDTKTLSLCELSNEQCQFSYRDSIFKREPNRYCIISITLRLTRKPCFKLDYGELRGFQGLAESLMVSQVREKIIAVRKAKLPEPSELPNAGSFFKNPIVTAKQEESIRKKFPGLVSYQLETGEFKLAAGWLIDQAGWKGKRQGPVGVHAKQALVLVNHDGGNQADILTLAQDIRASIASIFSVALEVEPKIVSSLSS